MNIQGGLVKTTTRSLYTKPSEISTPILYISHFWIHTTDICTFPTIYERRNWFEYTKTCVHNRRKKHPMPGGIGCFGLSKNPFGKNTVGAIQESPAAAKRRKNPFPRGKHLALRAGPSGTPAPTVSIEGFPMIVGDGVLDVPPPQRGGKNRCQRHRQAGQCPAPTDFFDTLNHPVIFRVVFVSIPAMSK